MLDISITPQKVDAGLWAPFLVDNLHFIYSFEASYHSANFSQAGQQYWLRPWQLHTHLKLATCCLKQRILHRFEQLIEFRIEIDTK